MRASEKSKGVVQASEKYSKGEGVKRKLDHGGEKAQWRIVPNGGAVLKLRKVENVQRELEQDFKDAIRGYENAFDEMTPETVENEVLYYIICHICNFVQAKRSYLYSTKSRNKSGSREIRELAVP